MHSIIKRSKRKDQLILQKCIEREYIDWFCLHKNVKITLISIYISSIIAVTSIPPSVQDESIFMGEHTNLVFTGDSFQYTGKK